MPYVNIRITREGVLAAGSGKFKVKRSTDTPQKKGALQFAVDLSAGTGWDGKIQNQSKPSKKTARNAEY